MPPRTSKWYTVNCMQRFGMHQTCQSTEVNCANWLCLMHPVTISHVLTRCTVLKCNLKAQVQTKRIKAINDQDSRMPSCNTRTRTTPYKITERMLQTSATFLEALRSKAVGSAASFWRRSTLQSAGATCGENQDENGRKNPMLQSIALVYRPPCSQRQLIGDLSR